MRSWGVPGFKVALGGEKLRLQRRRYLGGDVLPGHKAFEVASYPLQAQRKKKAALNPIHPKPLPRQRCSPPAPPYVVTGTLKQGNTLEEGHKETLKNLKLNPGIASREETAKG